MREAVKNVPLKPYHLLWQPSKKKEKFNCQDWNEEVRNEYERIRKEKEQQAYKNWVEAARSEYERIRKEKEQQVCK